MTDTATQDVKALTRDLTATQKKIDASLDKLADFAKATEKERERLTTLRERRRALRSLMPRRQTRTDLDPRVQAGQTNMRAAHLALVDLGGEARQADIGERAGIGSGTLTWSMKALEADGVVERLDGFDRRSPVFRLVDGGDRVTSLAPGE